jgi:uncharacterized membrane protein
MLRCAPAQVPDHAMQSPTPVPSPEMLESVASASEPRAPKQPVDTQTTLESWSESNRRWQTPDTVPPLAEVCGAFGLLFGESASLGLGMWGFTHGSQLLPYALDNTLSVPERQNLLVAVFGVASAAVLGTCGYLAARPREWSVVNRAAIRLCPLLFVGLLPFLFSWQLWKTREMTFGVLATVLGFTVERALRASLRVGPVFAPAELRDAVGRWVIQTTSKLGPRLPLSLVVIGALGYAAFFSYHTVAGHRNLLTYSYDLGLENNLMWNVVHGEGFFKSSPLSGPHGSHFGYHATFFSYVIAGFYVFWQEPEALLVFQAVMIGAAALPLYGFAKLHLGAWPAVVVALAYLLYPPVHGSNLYDFHYLPLGVFFLWLTLYLVEMRRYRLAALSVLLTLSVREDVAADLIILGAYLILSGRRSRAGLVIAAVAGVYFVLVKMVLMPLKLQGDSSFIHQWQGLLPAGDGGYGGVLKTVLANPVFTLTSLLEPEKFLYVVQIGAPLCFLPWRRPIGILCSLPGFFFTLLETGYLPLVQISFQYTAHWSAFLFIALVSNLAWVRRPAFPSDTGGGHRFYSWLGALAFLTLLTSHQYGAIFQQGNARGGFVEYRFGTTDEDRDKHDKLYRLIDKVPPRAKIVSSENIVPHVSSRPDSYTLRQDVYDAEYLLFEVPSRDDELSVVKRALAADFGVVAVEKPFVLAQRGYSKEQNAHVLRTLRQRPGS